jgi:hypothetical protein
MAGRAAQSDRCGRPQTQNRIVIHAQSPIIALAQWRVKVVID